MPTATALNRDNHSQQLRHYYHEGRARPRAAQPSANWRDMKIRNEIWDSIGLSPMAEDLPEALFAGQ